MPDIPGGNLLLDWMTHHHLPLQLWKEADTDTWVVVNNSNGTVLGSGPAAIDALAESKSFCDDPS